jgi:hypothetical protein
MPILTASTFPAAGCGTVGGDDMSAVESSYRELAQVAATADLHERFEDLDVDEATALLVQRYSDFCAQGYDWRRALLLAVELV